MSLEQDLLNLKNKSEKLHNLKIETTTKLNALEEEKNRLVDECKALGIDPANIEQTVKDTEAQLQAEIAALTKQVEEVLSGLNTI